MVNRYVTSILIGIIAVLIGMIYFQNEDTLNLHQSISEYKKQIVSLEKKLENIHPVLTTIQENQTVTKITQPNNSNESNFQSISAVAVRPVLESDGFFETTTYVGTVLKIGVEIRDGTGLVLVNTAIPTGVDFQSSARTAVMVAQGVTNFDLSKKDVIFSISSENQQELKSVDGGSAGGAMTILLISDISRKPISSSVLMTGTIQTDGTIGKIGGVVQKAEAAGKFGAKIFLVPKGQAVTEIQSCNERREGVFLYRSCTSEEKPLSELTEKEFGMKVVEVDQIKDALKYFNDNIG